MKRLLAFTLAILTVLSLCACGQEETPPVTTTETTTETTQETTTETTTEATEPPILYRHPLTGEPLEAPYTGRAIAVSIGNTKAALPQHGISDADWFFEIEAEGGITRFLPIFTDVDEVDTIGPVRSARTFFNSVAASFTAPIAHCGGSVRGIRGYYDLTGSKISDWEHIDQFHNASYFYRDQDRRSSGYALEHTLFTTGENLTACMESKSFSDIENLDYGYQFDEKVCLNGEKALDITVAFLGEKTSTFTYNANLDVYAIEQYDRELIDGTTGKQLTFKNLLVLYAPQSKKHDGSYVRSYYEIIGSGEGYYAVNGQIVKILWSREDVKTPFVFTFEDGTPITLGVGKTYAAISSPKSAPIEYK